MNILVTGIDGFVGSHLAEALLRLPGIQLFGTVRSSSGHINRLQPGITAIPTEITDPQQVQHAIEAARPEKIFHVAGQAFVPLSITQPVETFRTNIDGTLNVLEAVRTYTQSSKHPCRLLVVSSGEVYGAVRQDQLPIDETKPLQPSNPYAASKACADLLALQYRNTFGCDVVVARPFNHLGPRQSEWFVGSAFAKQIAEIKMGKREPKLFVGNLEPKRDFTDVRDVVRAYIAMLDHTLHDPVFNICSGTTVAIKDLLQTLLQLSGIQVEILPDPKRQRTNEIPVIVGTAARLRLATGWTPAIALSETLSDLLAYWEDRVRQS